MCEGIDPVTGRLAANGGGGLSYRYALSLLVMATIELDDELLARIESHLEDDETPAEFIAEVVTIYEQEGRFLQEGP